ncbi:hypothetical protein HY638_01025 [Candidatus Woesearchaeota archaeon]|nr:hypothetical protein [Candidatus Woesearchaeota archaeon]
MPSNKFVKTAKRIAERDKALFDELLEFEKTKKIRTKTRLNFTIDKGVASRFKRLCREKGYNMSARVEQAINKMIKKGEAA